MRKGEILGMLLGLVFLSGSASGQIAGAPVQSQYEQSQHEQSQQRGQLQKEVLSLLKPGSAQGLRAPSIVWGHREGSKLTCLPEAKAYVAQLGNDGTEVWRRDASLDSDGLLSGLTSIDPRHILASTIHDVATDPVTGQLYAIAETLMAWRGGDCESGVSTALGTLVLGLAPDGTPMRDTYLGYQPDGPPPAAVACHELCSVDRRPQMIGRGISVGVDGEVLVAGHRRTAEKDEVFATRLALDLSSRDGGSLVFPFSDNSSTLKWIPMFPGGTFCPPDTDPSRNLLDVRPMGSPSCGDCLHKEDLYSSSEGCRIRVNIDDGIDTTFRVAPGTMNLDIRLKQTCTPSGTECGLRLQMKDDEGEWILIVPPLNSSNGVLDTRAMPIQVPNASEYIDGNNRVHLRLIGGSGASADSDGDLDELDMVDS